MVALNFQKRFAPLVESGQKRQTIRALRKDGSRPFRHGVNLQLYTAMRTKHCRKLADAVCEMAADICIKENGTVKIDGQTIYDVSAEELARADGFVDRAEMIAWFKETHGLPFRGVLIQW